tara:strand:- start:270 stop:542 length:273 start_codon:yes stop_codon:yes gene_type:complete
MEIKLIEEKKNRIVFELDASQGFCTVLKDELWNDSKVKTATYAVDHPLVSKPRMIVETNDADPKKALAEAAARVKKKTEKFGSDFAKEVK